HFFGYYVFFFFSSRRRHTRFSRDWSSDVCSSDLYFLKASGTRLFGTRLEDHVLGSKRCATGNQQARDEQVDRRLCPACQDQEQRSEERRVGKECRARGWQYH